MMRELKVTENMAFVRDHKNTLFISMLSKNGNSGPNMKTVFGTIRIFDNLTSRDLKTNL